MKTILISLKIFLFFTVLTGIIYPLAITGIAQLFSPTKAKGSLIYKEGKAIGSSLIGQKFDSSIYFSSRPSAIDYNPMPSGGSNLGLTSSKLKKLVAERKQNFITDNQLDSLANLPAEMLFTSASGIDPDISPKAALLQINRIANARNLNPSQKEVLIKLVQHETENLQFSLLGEPRVNVLKLNMALDKACNDLNK